MTRMGERVMAVITSRMVDGHSAANTRMADEPGGLRTAWLDDARFIAGVLVAEGFELLNFHPLAISFAGPPALFRRIFGLTPVRRTFQGGRGRQVKGYDILPEDALRLTSLPPQFEGRAAMMAIARPPRLADDAGPPVRDLAAADLPVWSLPDELAISIWADGTGAPPVTGRGVVAAQIGTGHYRHRFFSDRGYKVLPTLLGPGQRQPQRDDHGHGTGEAACLFGAAPDLRLRPIKGLLDPVGDLLMTIDSTPTPDLIIASWGYDVDRRGWDDLEAADPNLCRYLTILDAVISFAGARGITVCAAAPRGWNSFPACHPDVIAIAAASTGRGSEQAGRDVGRSALYPGRQGPDLWSDAAKSVRAGLDLVVCTHPAQPGSVLARPGLHEDGPDAALAWCDIELAASPLAAGRIALLIEQHPKLSPAAIKALLMGPADLKSSEGRCAPAGEGGMVGTASALPGPLPLLGSEQPGRLGRQSMGSLAG